MGESIYQYTGIMLKNKLNERFKSYTILVTGKLSLLIELPSYMHQEISLVILLYAI